jgi:predicted acylesterase/phospholipase RssA
MWTQDKFFSLALGGGAARGIAHTGVIRKLEELGLQAWAVSGTSMGSIVATFYALGYDSVSIEKIAKEINLIKLIDFNMKKGIIEGKKILAFIEKYIGNPQFSETKIPLIIVATDIDTGEKVVFKEGSILEAIRASISIPGLFSPYNMRWRNLVDGGLTENLPITVLPPWPVIAVSVQIDIREKWLKKTEWLFKFWNEWLLTNGYLTIRKMIGIMMQNNEQASRISRENITNLQIWRSDIDYHDFAKVEELIAEWYRASMILEDFPLAKK